MSPLEQRMNALAEAADKMDYSGCSDSGVVMGYRKGFKAALELPEVKAMETALSEIGAYFDCLYCEMSTDRVCESHLEERMKIAIEALKSWREFKSKPEEAKPLSDWDRLHPNGNTCGSEWCRCQQ